MIIFINGSINSGKSTISKLLVESLPNTALIEIDSVRAMINWMPLEQAIPLNLENAVSLIRNFVKNNLNVVVPYPLSQKNYDYMISNLSGLNTDIHVFTLAPQLEKALTNRGNRELTDWERNRIQHHYDTGIHKPNFGEIIDNSAQIPQETTEIIMLRIKKND